MPSRLRSRSPFDLLPAEELERVAVHLKEIDAPTNHVFFREGESGEWAFLLTKGRVRIQHFRPDGAVRTVCMVGAGDTFCCLPVLDGGSYPATAVAAVSSKAYRLPGSLFRDLIARYPAFASRVLKMFCGLLREAGCEGCAQAGDASSRLAGKILSMEARFGARIPLTRKELAELAGTSVETAIRLTKEFERSGWVELGRGFLLVIDRPALGARSEGERPAVAIRLAPTPRKRSSRST